MLRGHDNQRMMRVKRAMWELFYGTDALYEGAVVGIYSRCGNKNCINPDHLGPPPAYDRSEPFASARRQF
jgi:hypothetical protein